ncbi:MAG: hypothetical protein QXI19_08325, partial [Candidatus Caldarchaeum sp.]
MKGWAKLGFAGMVLAIVAGAVAYLLSTQVSTSQQKGLPKGAADIAAARGLTPDDVEAALKTYVPTGKYDEYVMFSSAGHGGQVLVIGVPSMRILKVIGVFTPEPWQGYGFGSEESRNVIKAGYMPSGRKIEWGDTHHPALSETNGEYDGQYLFIGDKASARLAVVDLRDFETKQIVKSPNIISNHGAAFVTPNTEYVIEATQYAAPLPFGSYAPIDQYKEKYRGMISFYKFDRKKGRIDEANSFQVEVPP